MNFQKNTKHIRSYTNFALKLAKLAEHAKSSSWAQRLFRYFLHFYLFALFIRILCAFWRFGTFRALEEFMGKHSVFAFLAAEWLDMLWTTAADWTVDVTCFCVLPAFCRLLQKIVFEAFRYEKAREMKWNAGRKIVGKGLRIAKGVFISYKDLGWVLVRLGGLCKKFPWFKY